MGPRLPNRENPGSSFKDFGFWIWGGSDPEQAAVLKDLSGTDDDMGINRVPESADPLSHHSENKKRDPTQKGEIRGMFRAGSSGTNEIVVSGQICESLWHAIRTQAVNESQRQRAAAPDNGVSNEDQKSFI